jgi:Transcription elongation factor, GreA/GreB, C-term
VRLPTTTPGTPDRSPAELGCMVHVRDAEGEDAYTLVTSAKADPALGLISVRSPVGRALVGRSQGDQVEVITPPVCATSLSSLSCRAAFREGAGADLRAHREEQAAETDRRRGEAPEA